jgi:hypothetical protein
VREPRFRQRNLIDRALEPVADTPAAFARFLKENRVIAQRVVKAAGLEPQ